MRFLKGSISLQVRDQGLLHIVADARYITHSQLFQLARLKALEFQRAVFNWRVRRLVNSGLLRKQVVPFLGADGLYSITRGGIQALEEMGITYLGGYVERERDPQEVQIPHVLELNRIRFALERSGALLFWVPETFIRVLNLSPSFATPKRTTPSPRSFSAMACRRSLQSNTSVRLRASRNTRRFWKRLRARDGSTRFCT